MTELPRPSGSLVRAKVIRHFKGVNQRGKNTSDSHPGALLTMERHSALWSTVSWDCMHVYGAIQYSSEMGKIHFFI